MTRPRLLYLVHCYHNRAGVEHHVRYLRTFLADRFDIYVVSREAESLLLVRPDSSEVHLPTEKRTWLINKRLEPQTDAALDRVLCDVAPALVHIQHFAHWPLSMFERVAAFGAPQVVSFHDYYAISPHFTLQGIDDPRLLFEPKTSRQIFGQDLSPYLRSRLEFLRSAFSRVNVKVVPSAYLQRVLTPFLPFDYEQIPYGIPFFTKAPKNVGNQPLRFATLGSRIPQKGIDFAIDSFRSLRLSPKRAELHVIGGEGQDDLPGVVFHGVYEPSQLAQLLAPIDVGILPSLFAETYSMALSELWMAGVVPCVADLGALGERVTDGRNGKKFRAGDEEAFQQSIRWFIDNDQWRQWELPTPPRCEEMADRYAQLYRTALINR